MYTYLCIDQYVYIRIHVSKMIYIRTNIHIYPSLCMYNRCTCINIYIHLHEHSLSLELCEYHHNLSRVVFLDTRKSLFMNDRDRAGKSERKRGEEKESVCMLVCVRVFVCNTLQHIATHCNTLQHIAKC